MSYQRRLITSIIRDGMRWKNRPLIGTDYPPLVSVPETATLLRIFVGERDRADGLPLYEAIVMKVRTVGLAGATVIRAVMGYGHSSHVHTAKILRLSVDLPFVVEIVDAEDKIQAFLPMLDTMMGSGLVMLEKATVIRYGSDRPAP